MIQTQLLRLDPPYQIISAGGQVGIQLATLIVTEEKTTETGEYVIDTHSHPVVSYGLKEGLVEEFKYGSSYPKDVEFRNNRLQPEGAVWNKVEVSDIHVLGLAGADNRPVSMDTFTYLVPPSATFMPYYYVWDGKSLTKMFDLLFGFRRVGLRCEKREWKKHDPYDVEHRQMFMEVVSCDGDSPLVRVVLISADEFDLYNSNVGFQCLLYDEEGGIDGCANLIICVVRELENHFIKGRIDDKFSYWRNEEYQALDDLMYKLVDRVNEGLDLK